VHAGRQKNQIHRRWHFRSEILKIYKDMQDGQENSIGLTNRPDIFCLWKKAMSNARADAPKSGPSSKEEPFPVFMICGIVLLILSVLAPLAMAIKQKVDDDD
jgi:hypothetical protein